MTKEGETILWRRLDLPGHEIATIASSADGWRLEGVAVLVESGRPCRIEYEIRLRCAMDHAPLRDSRTRRRASREPRRAAGPDRRLVHRTASRSPALEGCDDIDLGFSPSTNLLPIRRLALPVGAQSVVRAAWIRFPELTAEVLVADVHARERGSLRVRECGRSVQARASGRCVRVRDRLSWTLARRSDGSAYAREERVRWR